MGIGVRRDEVYKNFMDGTWKQRRNAYYSYKISMLMFLTETVCLSSLRIPDGILRVLGTFFEVVFAVFVVDEWLKISQKASEIFYGVPLKLMFDDEINKNNG